MKSRLAKQYWVRRMSCASIMVTLQSGTRLKRKIFANSQIFCIQSAQTIVKLSLKIKKSLSKTGYQKQRLI